MTATTITISGSVPSGTRVTGYAVRWQRDTSVGCSNKDHGSVINTTNSFTRHTITGLEPGNRYTMTVTVFNGAGRSPVSNAVTVTTAETGRECSAQLSIFLGSYCFPLQLPLVVPPQSDVVQSLPVVSPYTGERYHVSTVMDR